MSKRLEATFRGRVLRPGDGDYDTQRAAVNPGLDARPVLVAEAAGPRDVQAAVTWARTTGVPLAVQATGHGTHVPSDGALLLKTSRMAGVLVDPDRRAARAGPGTRWAEVITAAAPFGLAPLSGTAPGVGVAGYTLGGGFGQLSRAFGLAAESLVRADVVTADGSLVTVSRERHPELFWALRGGGGNFGVVTSLEFRLHPVAEVYAGVARFPVERAAEFLARYRDWAPTAPDELSTGVLLGQGRTFTVKVLHIGDGAAARRALRPLWSEPVHEELRAVAYADVKLPALPPFGFGLFDTLPDPVIDGIVVAETQVEIKQWGGALARPVADAGPAGHPTAQFSVSGPGAAEAIGRRGNGGSFLNFLHDPAAVRTAFTPESFRRLRAVKRAYDPDNVFHVNLNIRPEGERDDDRDYRPA
ncbi:MAG TPA: FAD-binding oxidoreductase [Actinophytocola sp.]|uniref:FAD-binding oxidoreductase n=1 Tax=Actinophytocola sp. TaxID=1872138 RepID=UPI002DDCEF1C|nr:FAD-binding oxidoreductase [Actinophytocola sp.]HEV2784095.1 FAD-binding oxidoreductase [Actinophytocola sp.]